jgi:hypothetical protein
MKKLNVVFFLIVAVCVPLITIVAVKIAKGYSFNPTEKRFEPRGILVATSNPDGAQVFVNDKLETATNNTISLPPGNYKVEIKKDGFSPWVKELKIDRELVTKTEAYLLPSVTDLRPVTFSGAQNPSSSPDGTKIVYSIPATESAKSGIWVHDLVELPLGLSRGPKQIIKPNPKGRNFTKAQFFWSPDSRQLLITLDKESFLVDANQLTPENNLINSASALKSIKAAWKEEEEKILQVKIKRLPKQLQSILRGSVTNLRFSQDGEKLLYEATTSAQIPNNLIPPPPASSTQKEERIIEPGRYYVYDLKEDKNFFVSTIKKEEDSGIRTPVLSWFPTSRHLTWVEPGKISLIEYDGTNKTTVYAGPFEDYFVLPHPNSSKLIILTTFGQESLQPANLYTINLR